MTNPTGQGANFPSPNALMPSSAGFVESADNAGAGTSLQTAGSPPSGAVGGDLSGTLPNPTVAKLNGAAVAGYGASGDIAAEASGSTVLAGATGKVADAGHRHAMPTLATQGAPLGLTGAVAATRYVGATASGAPVAGTFAVGDLVVDQTGALWVCTVAGTPGTWVAVGARPTAHGCFAYEIGATQTINDSTDTKLTFTSESFDTDGYHSTSANTSRITIPAGLDGYYQVGGHCQFPANTSGGRAIRIEKNGVTVNGTGSQVVASTVFAGIGLETNTFVHLVAGDYVEVNAFQTSGGPLASGGTSGFDSNAIWAMLIGV